MDTKHDQWVYTLLALVAMANIFMSPYVPAAWCISVFIGIIVVLVTYIHFKRDKK